MEPVAKGRPQFTVIHGRPRAVTPAKTRTAEANIWTFIRNELPGDWVPLTGPLFVMLTAYRTMPAGIPKRDRPTALPTKRPDLDNYVKILDALDKLVWVDDAQIVMLRAEKKYAQPGELPRIEIAVKEIT